MINQGDLVEPRLGMGRTNRTGLVMSTFEAHLAGRVAHAARINPERGHRLKGLFERISW